MPVGGRTSTWMSSCSSARPARGQLRVALDDQHPRLARGEDQAAVAVVVEQRSSLKPPIRAVKFASRSLSIVCWKRKRFSPS